MHKDSFSILERDRGRSMLVINLKELRPGYAIVGEVLGVRLAVCMGDDGKLRIFRVVERGVE